ncbi:MAG TPA: hypothetical protein DDX19_27415 [Rhodopirellula baltica]|nr:hypothetical protein [Rhodopirellula baltica]
MVGTAYVANTSLPAHGGDRRATALVGRTGAIAEFRQFQTDRRNSRWSVRPTGRTCHGGDRRATGWGVC